MSAVQQGLAARAAAGLAAVALFAAPALSLSVRGGLNSGLMMLTLAALLWWALMRSKPPWRDARPLLVGLLAYPAVVLAQLALTGGRLSSFDPAARFVLACPLLLGLARLSWTQSRLFEWGCVVGAIGAAGWAIGSTALLGAARAGNPWTNPVPFGGMALTLGFLSLGSWPYPATIRPASDRRIVAGRLLAVTGAVAGAYACIGSQTRGSWLALPPMALLAWAMLWSGRSPAMRDAPGARRSRTAHLARIRRQAAVLAASLVLAATAFGFATGGFVSQRLAYTMHELRMARTPEGRDTSSGIRLQLWRASLLMAQEHPVLGVGKARFNDALQPLLAAGEVTAAAARPEYRHAHNDVLFALAELGLPGGLAAIALYLGPAVFFVRRRASSDPIVRRTAFAGLGVVVGFAVFGQTEAMWNLTMPAAFYALCVGVLSARLLERERMSRDACG